MKPFWLMVDNVTLSYCFQCIYTNFLLVSHRQRFKQCAKQWTGIAASSSLLKVATPVFFFFLHVRGTMYACHLHSYNGKLHQTRISVITVNNVSAVVLGN